MISLLASRHVIIGLVGKLFAQLLDALKYTSGAPTGMIDSVSGNDVEFTSSNGWAYFAGSHFVIDGILTTDTVEAFGSSAVPTIPVDGQLHIAIGEVAYGIGIRRGATLIAFYPATAFIINPLKYTLWDSLQTFSPFNGTLIGGDVSNRGVQNEYFPNQLGQGSPFDKVDYIDIPNSGSVDEQIVVLELSGSPVQANSERAYQLYSIDTSSFTGVVLNTSNLTQIFINVSTLFNIAATLRKCMVYRNSVTDTILVYDFDTSTTYTHDSTAFIIEDNSRLNLGTKFGAFGENLTSEVAWFEVHDGTNLNSLYEALKLDSKIPSNLDVMASLDYSASQIPALDSDNTKDVLDNPVILLQEGTMFLNVSGNKIKQSTTDAGLIAADIHNVWYTVGVPNAVTFTELQTAIQTYPDIYGGDVVTDESIKNISLK